VIGFVIPDALSQDVPREVSNYIDRLADADSNGRIDQSEHDEILKSIRMYHEVQSYLDSAFDRRHSGMVDHNDILLILQASAAGSRMLDSAIRPPYTVATPYDQFLDIDRDNKISTEELSSAVLLFSGVEVARSEVSDSMKKLCDWNDDGEIENREIRQAAGVLLLPHPVNPKEPVDVSGDVNGDGFIEPSELGISGGYSDEGEFMSLEALVRLSVYKMVQKKATQAEETEETGETTEGFKSEYYERLGRIQDRKLAVINFDNQTEGVNDETTAGIIVFVENAFVNVGKVRVVERKYVEEILDEYKFQSSSLIDEETAIEIGKLSGAEIIVVGSINRVGGTFYLNIKLIDVKTAEIIGSNIARAANESEFLDMCNEAVYLLF
jgi:TolB-like protein